MALPNTAVFAERAWPQGAVSVELTLDAGDDAQSNAWGPGLAIVASDGSLAQFIIRPNQQVFETPAGMAGAFDRAKPVGLRARLENGVLVCEAAQGETFAPVAEFPFAKTPAKLRIGKVGRGGRGQDHSAEGTPVRCHLTALTLRAAGPKTQPAPRTDLPGIDIHYVIYDGIPLIENWLVVRNTATQPVRVNKTVVETLKLMETEAIADPNINIELSSLYVESDYAFLAMNGKSANKQAVRWLTDKSYATQTSYFFEAPVLLEVAPEFGPDVDLPSGGELASIRAFELFRDGSDRERRGLAQRRMYRVIAPWSQENPVMAHLISSDPAAIRNMIGQAAEVGFEMVILSFGSGMNLESTDPKYQASYKELADYGKSKGVVIGSYSLLASRGAATAADNCRGPGNRIRYGVMPCLGAKWGQGYLQQMKDFMTNTGFGVYENDGSYPGDTCATPDHPGHRGLGDSQWVQFRAITGLYQWCRGNGIYLNVPDWYFLHGGSKTAMGYKENNWADFYKAHRQALDADIIHLRRPDGRDWDGILHVNPQGTEKALAFLYNPLTEDIEREIRLPLGYSGLTDKAQMLLGDAGPIAVTLRRDHSVIVKLRIPAQSRQWITFTAN